MRVGGTAKSTQKSSSMDIAVVLSELLNITISPEKRADLEEAGFSSAPLRDSPYWLYYPSDKKRSEIFHIKTHVESLLKQVGSLQQMAEENQLLRSALVEIAHTAQSSSAADLSLIHI